MEALNTLAANIVAGKKESGGEGTHSKTHHVAYHWVVFTEMGLFQWIHHSFVFGKRSIIKLWAIL